MPKLRRANSHSAEVLLRGLGRRVQEARKRRKMTQERLAETAGLGRRFVISLEMGYGNPTFIVLNDLARALRVPIKELTDKPTS